MRKIQISNPGGKKKKSALQCPSAREIRGKGGGKGKRERALAFLYRNLGGYPGLIGRGGNTVFTSWRRKGGKKISPSKKKESKKKKTQKKPNFFLYTQKRGEAKAFPTEKRKGGKTVKLPAVGT